MLFPAVAIAQQTAHDHTPKLDDLVAALGVKPGGKIADVGAGDGRYTFKLAAAVGPEGKVWAVDVAKSALRQLRRKVEEDKAGNVEVIEGKEDDPLLPKGELDAVLVVNAYHEMEEHKRMLGHMRDALKPGGRLVIVEHMPGKALLAKPRIEQQDKHALSPSFVEADLAEVGLERVATTTLAPETNHEGRYMVVARKN